MSELAQRSLFGALYVALVVLCLKVYSPLAPSLFVLLSLLCVIEVTQLSTLKRLNLGWFIGIWLLTWAAFYAPISPFITAGALGLLYSLSLALEKATWRVLYVLQPFVISIFAIESGLLPTYDFVLMVFILIWLNDSGAYLFGRSFGKTKLAPTVSPKKTWEGFLGGITTAAGLQLIIFPLLFDDSYWLYSIFAAILIGSAATVGDLIQSKMKRKAGVKDSGKILPGHGGAFDRLDSFIFALPVALLFYLVTYL